MFSRKSLVLTVVALILTAAVLGGCSGGDSDEMTTLDKVLDEGVLTVVGSGGYRPFNYYEGDEVVGFDVDTGKEIAKRLGVELNYETSAWDGLPEGLRTGRYDAILGSMAITEKRLETLSFTEPYYYSGAQLVVRKDAGITDPSQMEGKEIGVVTGETFTEDAEALGAEVAFYEDTGQILLEVINGRVDGMVTDRLVALGGMHEIARGDELTLAGDILRLEEMALAVRQEDDDLREKLNEILADMHADGTLRTISEKWHNGEDITVK